MQKRIAIVTGASGGFGLAFAKLLVAEKDVDEIWAIARNHQKLAQLKSALGVKIRIFPMDLSCEESFSNFGTLLKQERPRILYLINNAGFAKLCASNQISIEESRNMIDLNCSAVVSMVHVCIPYMARNARILNVASQAAFQPLPYMGLYSATKAFVRSYSRALHVELRHAGITVTAVCPGWMDTDLFSRAKTDARKAPSRFWGMASPAQVAYKALRDAKDGKDMSVFGVYVKSCHVAAKLLPQRFIMWGWLKMQGL